MVYIHNGIYGVLFRYKKKWNLAISYNIDGLRGYYAKWNKSDRERQTQYNFTYMMNLKIKQINKHNKTETESYRYREQRGDCQRRGRWREERWGRLRGTNFQLQNKWVTWWNV